MSLKTGGATGITENKDGLTIIKATYGVQSALQDVTTEVQSLVNDGELNFTVSAQSLGVLDPAPGVTKTFQMQYKINGGNISLYSKDDGGQVVLSVPTVTSKSSAAEDGKKAPSFTGIVWYFICGLFVAFFTVSSYWAGNTLLGSPAAGIIFGAISALTYGMFGLIFVPMIIFAYYIILPNHNPI
jgi:hypothetical protein